MKVFFVRTKKVAMPSMLLKNKLIVIMELGKSKLKYSNFKFIYSFCATL